MPRASLTGLAVALALAAAGAALAAESLGNVTKALRPQLRTFDAS